MPKKQPLFIALMLATHTSAMAQTTQYDLACTTVVARNTGTFGSSFASIYPMGSMFFLSVDEGRRMFCEGDRGICRRLGNYTIRQHSGNRGSISYYSFFDGTQQVGGTRVRESKFFIPATNRLLWEQNGYSGISNRLLGGMYREFSCRRTAFTGLRVR